MFFALLAASSVLATTPYPEPITPAASGQMQCYSPDTVRKTCASLAIYKDFNEGKYTNIAIVLLSASPALVMEASSPVYIKDKAVCGVPRVEDISSSKLLLNDRVLTEAEAEPVREQIIKSFSDMNGREVCTVYIKSGATLTARAYIDGVVRPELDQTVIWVSPQDGYRVSP